MAEKEEQFERLDPTGEKLAYGQLQILSVLAEMIANMRESLTRQLVVNGANDCETEEDMKKRWEGLDLEKEKEIEQELEEDIRIKVREELLEERAEQEELEIEESTSGESSCGNTCNDKACFC